MATSPTNAFTIYSGIDLNKNPSINLVSTTGIPNSAAAETLFKSNLLGTGTETFESFTDGQLGPLPIVFPGAGTASLSGGGGKIRSIPAGATTPDGRYGVSPTNYFEVVAGSANDFIVSFSEPVAAFGFYGIDIGDFAGTLSLAFDNGSIGTLGVPTALESQADGSVLYYGIITTPTDGNINSLTFKTTTGTGDFFGFDNFTIGSRQQVVPPKQGLDSVPGQGCLKVPAP